MSVFIFQSVLERYDLSKIIQPGKRDTWYATRYRGEMHPDDLVFFWMAGPEAIRGLYGWGNIASEPYLQPEWNNHGVDITYQVKFTAHITAKTVRADPDLSQMLIFRAPAATNFLLPEDQSKRLIELIQEQGERAPSGTA